MEWESQIKYISTRFIFTLNSRVLAADDIWRPLNLTSMPMFMNLYDPAILTDKFMSTILPQFPTDSMRADFARQRQQDVYCLGGKTNCFDRPVGGWVNEFAVFNAHKLPQDMLRSLIAETLIRKEPLDFGIHVFGNGNFWSGFVDDSDGFPSNLKFLELDLELATE